MSLTKQEVQRRLQQLTPERQQAFMDKQQAFHADTVVEFEQHVMLPLYRQFSLMHTNEVRLDVSFEYWYYVMAAKIEQFKLADIIAFLTAADVRTFREWLNTKPYTSEQLSGTVPLTEWGEFRRYILYLSNIVNPMIDEFTEKTLDSLLRQQTLDLTGQSKSLPLHKR